MKAMVELMKTLLVNGVGLAAWMSLLRPGASPSVADPAKSTLATGRFHLKHALELALHCTP